MKDRSTDAGIGGRPNGAVAGGRPVEAVAGADVRLKGLSPRQIERLTKQSLQQSS